MRCDHVDAHRQLAMYGHKGNRAERQLDNARSRIGENTRDRAAPWNTKSAEAHLRARAHSKGIWKGVRA